MKKSRDSRRKQTERQFNREVKRQLERSIPQVPQVFTEAIDSAFQKIRKAECNGRGITVYR